MWKSMFFSLVHILAYNFCHSVQYILSYQVVIWIKDIFNWTRVNIFLCSTHMHMQLKEQIIVFRCRFWVGSMPRMCMYVRISNHQCFFTIYSNINPVCNLIQQKRIEFYSQHSTCIGCFGPNLAVGIFVPHIEVWNFFH